MAEFNWWETHSSINKLLFFFKTQGNRRNILRETSKSYTTEWWKHLLQNPSFFSSSFYHSTSSPPPPPPSSSSISFFIDLPLGPPTLASTHFLFFLYAPPGCRRCSLRVHPVPFVRLPHPFSCRQIKHSKKKKRTTHLDRWCRCIKTQVNRWPSTRLH